VKINLKNKYRKIEMNKIIYCFLWVVFSTNIYALTIDCGSMQIDIDNTGKLTRIFDVKNKKNYINKNKQTYLMLLKSYSDKNLQAPKSLKILKKRGKDLLVRLTYNNNINADIFIRQERGWFHLELKRSNNVKEIDAVRWGPFYTNITGSIGEFVGLLHGEYSTLGLMSLEPNTDNECIAWNGNINVKVPAMTCAKWLAYSQKGTSLLLDSTDHTRPRKIENFRYSTPLPSVTVIGSKVALHLSEKGKVLDKIEQIIKKEGLPYLTIGGVWIKKAVRMQSPSVWSSYGERDVSRVIDLCHKFDGSVISSFSRMFGNWGHFSIDPQLYPGGTKAVKKASDESIGKGIYMNMHTLTNFIKPINVPEPFITPVIDKDFARYGLSSALTKKIDNAESTLSISLNDNLKKFFSNKNKKNSWDMHVLLELNNEIILFDQWEVKGNSVLFHKCKRGYLMTKTKNHKQGEKVKFLYYGGYKCLFAGNLNMLLKVARNIGNVVSECGIRKVSLDGHESCCATGHGNYAMNKVLLTLYNLNKDREMIYTGSRITNYCANILGYLSWGEFDLKKGFRGTMLDYRINRQVQLQRNLIPHKLGQHYPSKATLEDVNWLMGQALGWDGGVELSIDLALFDKNPAKEQIIAAVHKWEEARKSGKISWAQKLRVSQIDRVYDIQKAGKGWKLIPIKKRWVDERCKVLPSSVIKLESVSGDVKALPTKIDLSWTHNPLIYKEAAISNDMPMLSGKNNAWNVTYPKLGATSSDINGNFLKLVIRVPEDSPTGITNPVISINNCQSCVIPATLKPGEYLATPLNVPYACIYNKNNEVIDRVYIKLAYTLPNMTNKEKFKINCTFDPIKKGKTGKAVLNLFYSAVLK
jgi:hypothetical protein